MSCGFEALDKFKAVVETFAQKDLLLQTAEKACIQYGNPNAIIAGIELFVDSVSMFNNDTMSEAAKVWLAHRDTVAASPQRVGKAMCSQLLSESRVYP